MMVFEQNSGVGDDGGVVGVDAAVATLSVGKSFTCWPLLGLGVARGSDRPVTGRMSLAGSYEVTYVACSTVVLWWPADGRVDGSCERHT